MQDKSNKCPKCDTSYDPEQKFCSVCGHKFTGQGEVQTASAQRLYACPTCGQVTEYGIQYCTGCGALFNWHPDRGATTMPASPEQQPQKQKGRSGAKAGTRSHPWVVPFLSILGVAIVIGVIVIVFFTDALGGLFRQSNIVYNVPPPGTPAVTTPAPATPVNPATSTTPVTAIKAVLISYSGITTMQIGGHIYPEPGNTFLVIDFNIENQGYDSFSLNPLKFQVTVNNVKYYADIAASSDIAPDLEAAVLKGGQKTTGKLAFEVLSSSFIPDFKIAYTDTAYSILWIRK